jgi:hypothetical protein
MQAILSFRMVVIAGMLLFIYTSPRLLPISNYRIYIHLDSVEQTYLMRFVDHIPKSPRSIPVFCWQCALTEITTPSTSLKHLFTRQICCVK